MSVSCSLLGILPKLKLLSFADSAPHRGEFQRVLLISGFPPELGANTASSNFHPPEPPGAELQSPWEPPSVARWRVVMGAGGEP